MTAEASRTFGSFIQPILNNCLKLIFEDKMIVKQELHIAYWSCFFQNQSDFLRGRQIIVLHLEPLYVRTRSMKPDCLRTSFTWLLCKVCLQDKSHNVTQKSIFSSFQTRKRVSTFKEKDTVQMKDSRTMEKEGFWPRIWHSITHYNPNTIRLS